MFLFQGAWTLKKVMQSAKSQSHRSPAVVEEKFNMIVNRLEEVMGAEEACNKLRGILAERDLKVYWGTATTGQPHIGYFVPMSKIADFLRAGSEVTILFADLHAYLDNMKAPWELLVLRTKYYEHVIKAMLRSIGVPLEKLRFITGTSFQLSREYTLDMYRLTSLTTERNARKAGADVVKQVESPLLSGLLYPLLQALDEEYLKVDAQFGGLDQRKIFALCETYLPKIGYAKRLHLMNPMVPGLQGKKMSSSDNRSKIDLLDSEEEVNKKVRDALCAEGQVYDTDEEGNQTLNGVLSFVKMVLFPLCKGSFKINRPAKFGGDVEFKSYEELEAAFAAKLLYPLDLKNAVAKYLNMLLQPIRDTFYNNPELVELTRQAYPDTRGDWTPGVEAKRPEGKAKPNQAKQQQPAKETKENKEGKQGEGKQGGGKQGGGKQKGGDQPRANDVSQFEIRVGKILEIKAVPDSEKLYVEQIDFGSHGQRTVVSGLRKHISLEDMKDRLVCVLLNLKPAKLAGTPSEGMVLAATHENKVELIDPPSGSAVGELITFNGFPSGVAPPRVNEKVMKSVLAEMKLVDGIATYRNVPFTTPSGSCRASTLSSGTIS